MLYIDLVHEFSSIKNNNNNKVKSMSVFNTNEDIFLFYVSFSYANTEAHTRTHIIYKTFKEKFYKVSITNGTQPWCINI